MPDVHDGQGVKKKCVCVHVLTYMVSDMVSCDHFKQKLHVAALPTTHILLLVAIILNYPHYKCMCELDTLASSL